MTISTYFIPVCFVYIQDQCLCINMCFKRSFLGRDLWGGGLTTLARTSGAVLMWWHFMIVISRCRSSRIPWTARPMRLNAVWMSSPPCSFKKPKPTLNLCSCLMAWSSSRWSFGVTFSLGNICLYVRMNSSMQMSEIGGMKKIQYFEGVRVFWRSLVQGVMRKLNWNRKGKGYFHTWSTNVFLPNLLCFVDSMMNFGKLQKDGPELAATCCCLPEQVHLHYYWYAVHVV